MSAEWIMLPFQSPGSPKFTRHLQRLIHALKTHPNADHDVFVHFAISVRDIQKGVLGMFLQGDRVLAAALWSEPEKGGFYFKRKSEAYPHVHVDFLIAFESSKGYGTALLKRIEHEIKTNAYEYGHINAISLECAPDACGFFKKHHYKSSTRKTYTNTKLYGKVIVRAHAI